jgi:RHS repeat-associated protein
MGFSTQKFFPEHTPKAALSTQLWHEKTASRKFFDLTKIASKNSPAKPTTAREKSDRTYETAPEVINEHYRYTAFGEPEIYDSSGNKLATSAIKNEILWNSRRYDSATNLYYYKYRHYSPALGRWPSRDPLGDEAFFKKYVMKKIQSPEYQVNIYKVVRALIEESHENHYVYCNNDSVGSIDEYGLDRRIVTSNFANVHEDIIVDNWNVVNGKYVKAANATKYGVGAAGFHGMTPWGGSGLVYEEAYASTVANSTHKSGFWGRFAVRESNPCEDAKLHATMELMVGRPYYYHVIISNCWHFASGFINDGITTPCCNPDRTLWRAERGPEQAPHPFPDRLAPQSCIKAPSGIALSRF